MAHITKLYNPSSSNGIVEHYVNTITEKVQDKVADAAYKNAKKLNLSPEVRQNYIVAQQNESFKNLNVGRTMDKVHKSIKKQKFNRSSLGKFLKKVKIK